MAEKEMRKIVKKMTEQWPEVRVAVEHRIGYLAVGEISVAVVAASPHREEAFLAGKFIIDQIKMTVPIWKKQETSAGSYWKNSCGQ